MCDYHSSNKFNYDKHLSSVKHCNKNAKKSCIQNCLCTSSKNSDTVTTHIAYNCDICDYHSNNKFNYDKHLSSKKHITNVSKIIYAYRPPQLFAIKNNIKTQHIHLMSASSSTLPALHIFIKLK